MRFCHFLSYFLRISTAVEYIRYLPIQSHTFALFCEYIVQVRNELGIPVLSVSKE